MLNTFIISFFCTFWLHLLLVLWNGTIFHWGNFFKGWHFLSFSLHSIIGQSEENYTKDLFSHLWVITEVLGCGENLYSTITWEMKGWVSGISLLIITFSFCVNMYNGKDNQAPSSGSFLDPTMVELYK